MTVPTPLNDQTRDDRFDRGLERLLDGDPRGIDEIEPDLRDISLQMVSLANDAGWVGNYPGETARRSRFRNAKTIINALAAVLMIGVIGSMIMLGIQVWGPGVSQYGSGDDENVPVVSGPGVCNRLPRSDAELVAIVRKSEDEVEPYGGEGVQTNLPDATMQLTRNWNSCLQSGQWDRAMAYEGEYFIWSLGQDEFPDGTSGLTDAEIVTRLQERHASMVPINTPDGLNLRIYTIESFIYDRSTENPGALGANIWVVPVDDLGDWIEWPTVVTSAWDGEQWVVLSTTQQGIPASKYQGDNAQPSTPEPGTGTPGPS